MADYRQIQTRTWSDSWFSELAPDAKLLFLYLITNEHATVTGMYEIPIRVIAFETGLDAALISSALDVFERSQKCYYRDGWLLVVNMQHYQASSSPKIAARIAADLAKVPSGEIKRLYLERYDTVSGNNDRVSIPYPGKSKSDSEQSRAEQNRSEQSREESAAAAKPAITGVVFDVYQKNIGPLTSIISEIIQDAVLEYSETWIVAAIDEAVQSNARSWKYCEAILKRWKQQGFKSAKNKPNAVSDKRPRQAASSRESVQARLARAEAQQ